MKYLFVVQMIGYFIFLVILKAENHYLKTYFRLLAIRIHDWWLLFDLVSIYAFN